MRFVTKKYQIVEIFTRVGLFKSKLNSDNLESHLLQTINEHLMLPIFDWVAVQLDRSSTNKAAISNIKSECLDANPTQNFCASHDINNASKYYLIEPNLPSILENYGNSYFVILERHMNMHPRYSKIQ